MSSGSSVPAPGQAAFSHPRPLLGVPNGSQHTPRPTSRPVPGSSQAGSWAGLRAPTFLGAVPPPPAWGTEPCRLQSCPQQPCLQRWGSPHSAGQPCVQSSEESPLAPASPCGCSPSASLSGQRTGRPVTHGRRGRREARAGCRHCPCGRVTTRDGTGGSSFHRARWPKTRSAPMVPRGPNTPICNQALRNGDRG